MARRAVELDFLGVAEKGVASPSGPAPSGELSTASPASEGAISRINPELLKSVIAAPGAAHSRSPPFSAPATPKPDQNAAPALPVYAPLVRPSPETHGGEVAPLTIFYGGTVVVFDLPPNKAENILKLAFQGISKATGPETPEAAAASSGQEQLLGMGDLPQTRTKSLERFFEKRKERLTFASPYSRDK